MLLCPETANTKMKLGMWGEDVVRKELQRAGYDVRKQRKLLGGDLYACGLKIEVKASQQAKDGTYNYCLTKDDKYGATDHTRADVVILLAVSASGITSTFVVPCEALTDKNFLKLYRLRGYRGKYAEYKKPILEGLKKFIRQRGI